jgi:hypothetical protein
VDSMKKGLSAAVLQLVLRVHQNREGGGIDELAGGEAAQNVTTFGGRPIESRPQSIAPGAIELVLGEAERDQTRSTTSDPLDTGQTNGHSLAVVGEVRSPESPGSRRDLPRDGSALQGAVRARANQSQDRVRRFRHRHLHAGEQSHPAEHSLVEMDEHQRLRDIRMYFQHATEKTFREVIERTLGRQVRAFISGIDTCADVSSEVFHLEGDAGRQSDVRSD